MGILKKSSGSCMMQAVVACYFSLLLCPVLSQSWQDGSGGFFNLYTPPPAQPPTAPKPRVPPGSPTVDPNEAWLGGGRLPGENTGPGGFHGRQALCHFSCGEGEVRVVGKDTNSWATYATKRITQHAWHTDSQKEIGNDLRAAYIRDAVLPRSWSMVNASALCSSNEAQSIKVLNSVTIFDCAANCDKTAECSHFSFWGQGTRQREHLLLNPPTRTWGGSTTDDVVASLGTPPTELAHCTLHKSTQFSPTPWPSSPRPDCYALHAPEVPVFSPESQQPLAKESAAHYNNPIPAGPPVLLQMPPQITETNGVSHGQDTTFLGRYVVCWVNNNEDTLFVKSDKLDYEVDVFNITKIAHKDGGKDVPITKWRSISPTPNAQPFKFDPITMGQTDAEDDPNYMGTASDRWTHPKYQ